MKYLLSYEYYFRDYHDDYGYDSKFDKAFIGIFEIENRNKFIDFICELNKEITIRLNIIENYGRYETRRRNYIAERANEFDFNPSKYMDYLDMVSLIGEKPKYRHDLDNYKVYKIIHASRVKVWRENLRKFLFDNESILEKYRNKHIEHMLENFPAGNFNQNTPNLKELERIIGKSLEKVDCLNNRGIFYHEEVEVYDAKSIF